MFFFHFLSFFFFWSRVFFGFDIIEISPGSKSNNRTIFWLQLITCLQAKVGKKNIFALFSVYRHKLVTYIVSYIISQFIPRFISPCFICQKNCITCIISVYVGWGSSSLANGDDTLLFSFT